MTSKEKNTRGWGIKTQTGLEMWDARPVITREKAGVMDWLKLLFFPKKLLLYAWLKKYFGANDLTNETGSLDNAIIHDDIVSNRKSRYYRILDFGCGTGASVIELKKLFGDTAEVIGVDISQLQIDIARQRLREYGAIAEVRCFQGERLPFSDASFDAVYTSDVLGHVTDAPLWLGELARVLKHGGALSMFCESRLGKHAYIRNYMLRRGLNVDPHSEFHISLYSKKELRQLIENAGFEINKMYSTVWAKFFVHPDELYPALQASRGFPILRRINALLFFIKKISSPVSTAFAELYSLFEMLTVGRIVESQGYVVLGKKSDSRKSDID